MPTQYTPTLKLALPVTGELSGTWGTVVNDNITSMIEQAIAGLSTINTWTSNSHTLTTANGTTSESRCAMLVAATGSGGSAITGAGEIICPASAKLYVVQNTTSFAVTLKTSAGTGVAVAAGNTLFLFCDGTNVNSCVTTIVSGNVTGNWTVGGNLTVDGNTTLGNATTDTITATGRFATDLLPSTDNSRDLGSAANSWKDLYIDGTATIGLATITANSSSAALRVTQTGAGNALLVEDSANPDSTPFVIDQFGVVVSGNTTPVTATLGPRIQAQVIDATAGFSSIRFSADGGGVQNVWAKSRGALGTNTIVASGDIIGTLNFSGADGTNYIQAATITASVDGTPGTNDMPGRLLFSTTADGASTPTERMRITSAGVFGFNSTITGGGASGAYRFAGNITGSVTSGGILYTPTINSDVTTQAALFQTQPSTEDNSFTLSTLTHFIVGQGTITGGSRTPPTTQNGFVFASSVIGATNNYGFVGSLPAGTGRYNLYMSGSADNYLAGSLGIGALPSAGQTLFLNQSITGNVNSTAVRQQGTVNLASVTTSCYAFDNVASTTATAATLPTYIHYHSQQGTFGAGSTVTSQIGFASASTLIGATNNYGFYAADTAAVTASKTAYGFYSLVNTASGGGTAYGFYAAGTAPNVFNNLGVTSTLGYTTGGGGVVTQGTSRTTAVTLNKASGQITMFTAAGSASWATFQVNNSLVAATDTVALSVNGATNSYVMTVSSIAAGAFTILFSSVIGTASDTPKINFTVIKGATS